jgi:hypothetical protein
VLLYIGLPLPPYQEYNKGERGRRRETDNKMVKRKKRNVDSAA